MEKNDTQKQRYHGRKRSLSNTTSQKKVNNASSEVNGSNNRPRRRNNSSNQKKRSQNDSQSEKSGLRWRTNFHCPTNAAEESLLPLLLKYGEKERGMMKTQPYFRIKAIRDKCREMHMTPEQAYSMRRTHMMLMLNNPKKFGLLRLGSRGAIRESAEIFEEAVAQFLGRQHISYISEEEQKNSHTDGPTPPTPDFLLKEPLLLNGETTIHWIEAKMFYGASNVPQGTPNAVGCVMATVEKYVKHYGQGAIVFSFGCGEDLRTKLEEKGVKVLDPSLLNLKQMRDHQKTWCANEKGWILP